MNHFLQEIEKIGRDLLNLEITTILADNISAEKMPEPSIAIKQVAAAYYSIISKYKNELVVKERDTFLDMQDGRKITVFSRCVEILKPELENFNFCSQNSRDDNENNSRWFILYRIRQTSEQLQRALNDKTLDQCDKELSTDALVLIRKAWEIGGEEIVLQTVVQIDGDVFTRVNRKYAMSDEVSKTLHQFHHQGVSVSVGWWKELIGVLKCFINVIPRLLGKKH